MMGGCGNLVQYIVGLVGLCFVCSGCSNENYKIEIVYSDPFLAEPFLYFVKSTGGLDSSAIVENRFLFTGRTDSILFGYVATRTKGNMKKMVDVIIEPEMDLKIKIDREVYIDDGEGVNSIKNRFDKDFSQLINQDMQVYHELVRVKTDKEKVRKYLLDVKGHQLSFWLKAVDENRDNMAGAAIFAEHCGRINDMDLYEAEMNKIRYARYFPAIENMRNKLQHQIRSSVGAPYIDVEGLDMKGNKVRLSDYVGKGKYIVVYFWSSWYGSGTGEFPNILEACRILPPDKFGMIGLNIYDKYEKFKKTILKEKINYPQIFLEDEEKADEFYAINEPSYFILISPEGKILNRGFHGEDLLSIISGYLNGES